MSGEEDYGYDEESGEWMPASELAERRSAGNRLSERGNQRLVLRAEFVRKR